MALTPVRGAFTDYSGSITAGGTAQTAESAGLVRNYLLFQNISDTAMWINFGTTAVADQPSILVAAGTSLVFDNNFVPTGNVSIICATTGKKFVLKVG